MSDRLEEILERFAEWTIKNVEHGIYIPLPSPETKQALQSYIDTKIIEAAYKANRDVITEQEKYLQDMTLEDGKTVIKALAVGMMYACANNLAIPMEAELKLKGEKI